MLSALHACLSECLVGLKKRPDLQVLDALGGGVRGQYRINRAASAAPTAAASRPGPGTGMGPPVTNGVGAAARGAAHAPGSASLAQHPPCASTEAGRYGAQL
jgi:hypothetical protein